MPKSPSHDRRELAALTLAKGMSRVRAGEAAGVDARTVRRWLQDAEFNNRIVELRKELVGEAVAVLAGLTRRAARTLGRLLRSNNEHIQLRAAISILESSVRLRESVELEARLTELEALAKGRPSPHANGFHRRGATP